MESGERERGFLFFVVCYARWMNGMIMKVQNTRSYEITVLGIIRKRMIFRVNPIKCTLMFARHIVSWNSTF